jgi:hypothetical protein
MAVTAESGIDESMILATEPTGKRLAFKHMAVQRPRLWRACTPSAPPERLVRGRERIYLHRFRNGFSAHRGLSVRRRAAHRHVC